MEQLTPLTREEEVLNTLLQAANGGTVEDLNPEWRKEKWFQNILDAINGNELTYDLVSEWRREDWYQAFIDAIQEGGGGSVPEYEGSYTVTPSESAQTLSCKDKKMTDDVSVAAISSTYIGSGVTQKAAATYTPTTSDQSIAANQYLAGAQTVKGDANLVAGNIKKDVQMFGVTGTYEGGELWDQEPPNDGKTRLYIDLTEEYKSPYLGFSFEQGCVATIDWGDGSEPEEALTQYTLHNYPHGGKYIITIEIKNANAQLTGYTSSQNYTTACGYLFTAQDAYTVSNNGNKNNFYANAVKKIYIGKNVYIKSGAFVNFQGLTKIVINSQTAFSYQGSPTQIFKGCVNLSEVDLTQSGIKELGEMFFASCFRMGRVVIPSSVLAFGSNVFRFTTAISEMVFMRENPPSAYSGSIVSSANTKYYIPFASLAAYLTASNYPAPATYTYIGFGTFADQAELPTQDTTQAYNVTWYATKEDAIAQTNAITVGNGNEVYCRYTAV